MERQSALKDQLSKDASPLGKARYHYYLINNGPWSDLDDHAAFLPDVPPKKLPGANFYPADMTKAEFEAWVKKLPASAAGAGHRILYSDPARGGQGPVRSFPTVRRTRRDLNARGVACSIRPPIATPNASLKNFLHLRAQAFLEQRLLRERRRVDAARRADRRDHRALRDLQRRTVRLQGRV